MASEYQPKPIFTGHVAVNGELLPLTERLAANAHDLWASQRMAQGWRFGPQRDDASKFHPCLVPYSDLPESEKEYDRIAAMGTIKAILALGYVISTGTGDLVEAEPCAAPNGGPATQVANSRVTEGPPSVS